MIQSEIHFSVDIETAGPTPANYALLSIGACLAADLNKTFYCELQPDRSVEDPEAMRIHGLSLERLKTIGCPPKEAIRAFADWIEEQSSDSGRPVFVALNAAFDWMFINDYFYRYLGRNPFGHFPLDIKALYMGLKRVAAAGRVKETIDRDYPAARPLTHNALQDAIDQARLFNRIMTDLHRTQIE